jgi:hypothetical protein
MLIHVDHLEPEKFLKVKIDHERGRRYFAMPDPLVLIRLDGDIELKQGDYYDASVGWDRGDATFVCAENVGCQHTKITLRKSYGPQPPDSFDPSEFRTLSQIMADAPHAVTPRFDSNAIADEVIGQLRGHVTRIGLRVYVGGVLPQAHDADWCDLKAEIDELCRIANGEIDRKKAGQEFSDETSQLIQDIAELCAPYYSTRYTIPDDWRKTALGHAWDAARFWLLSDDMITLSEAARTLYDAADSAELGKLERAIARGDLDEYNDPSEANPRKSKRVLKRQVRALLKKRDR